MLSATELIGHIAAPANYFDYSPWRPLNGDADQYTNEHTAAGFTVADYGWRSASNMVAAMRWTAIIGQWDCPSGENCASNNYGVYQSYVLPSAWGKKTISFAGPQLTNGGYGPCCAIWPIDNPVSTSTGWGSAYGYIKATNLVAGYSATVDLYVGTVPAIRHECDCQPPTNRTHLSVWDANGIPSLVEGHYAKWSSQTKTADATEVLPRPRVGEILDQPNLPDFPTRETFCIEDQNSSGPGIYIMSTYRGYEAVTPVVLLKWDMAYK
ncbi:MAG: hypothetical protein V1929_01095 [bacterium]